MTMYGRSLTEIVGWAQDGAAYCVNCVPSQPESYSGVEGDEPSPVFLSDASDLTCDSCFDYLDDDYTPPEPEPEVSEPPYRWRIKLSYVDPDGDWEPEGGYTYTGDCTRVTFMDGDEEIDTLDFTDPQEMMSEIEYWVFNEDPDQL